MSSLTSFIAEVKALRPGLRVVIDKRPIEVLKKETKRDG